MKILLSWLQEFVPFTADARELATDLSLLGFAVDAVASEDGETVLEIDVTTNRPDCLSHYGIAPQVAAAERPSPRPQPLRHSPRSGRPVPGARGAFPCRRADAPSCHGSAARAPQGRHGRD